MSKNEVSAVMISRLLTLENKLELLSWARLAYTAEKSARKSPGFGAAGNGGFTRKTQEYSCCNNNLKRRKK